MIEKETLDKIDEIRKYNESLTEGTATDYELCKACGGKCCKNVPCALLPSQLHNVEFTYDGIKNLLDTGNYSLDYWFENHDGEWYFIRYRAKGAPIADYDYVGDDCVMLDPETGCMIPFSERGADGRALAPGPDHSCHGSIGKRDMGMSWLPYNDILSKLWDEIHYDEQCRGASGTKSRMNKILDNFLGLAGIDPRDPE